MNRSLLRILCGTFCFAGSAGVAAAAEFPSFRMVEIDPNCGKVCYAVAVADVDGDERQDIVAVTEDRVLWYQAPDWAKRVILEGQTIRDNVCIAAHDVDGDGKVDFALGAGWLGKNVGTIQWLSRRESLDEPWHVHLIAEEPWTHRLRFADVLGRKTPQLVVSPLNRTQGDGVRLTAFEIPKNPRMDRWPATVLDDSLNRMHNHWHVHLNRDGQEETLTASQEGVHVITRRNGEWTKRKVHDGASGEKPEARGAGEIKFGTLAKGPWFIATVEPMHGTMAVVYVRHVSGEGEERWERHVLDETLRRGHAVWCADLDGDESDEIVVGHSEPGTGDIKTCGLYVYDAADETGTKWTKHVIDAGGVAVEDAAAADVTGDGKADIVAGGRDTHNIRLYVNEGE
jgi:hypothetical protein